MSNWNQWAQPSFSLLCYSINS